MVDPISIVGLTAAIVAAILAATGPVMERLWRSLKSLYGRACNSTRKSPFSPPLLCHLDDGWVLEAMQDVYLFAQSGQVTCEGWATSDWPLISSGCWVQTRGWELQQINTICREVGVVVGRDVLDMGVVMRVTLAISVTWIERMKT